MHASVFTYLQVYLCVSMYEDACAHVFVEVGGPPGLSSSWMPPTSLRQGLSHCPELIKSWSCRDPLVSVSPALLLQAWPMSGLWHFNVGFGDQVQLLVFKRQVLYEVSHLLNLWDTHLLPDFMILCLLYRNMVEVEGISLTQFLQVFTDLLAIYSRLSDKQFMQCFLKHTSLLAKNSELKYWPEGQLLTLVFVSKVETPR